MTRGRKRLRGSPYTLWGAHPANTVIKFLLQNWERVSFYSNCYSSHGSQIHPPHKKVMGLPGNPASQALTQAQWTTAAVNSVPRWWEGLKLGGTAISHPTVLTLSWRWPCTSVESIYDNNVCKISRKHTWNSIWVMWFFVCASSQGLDGNKHKEHSGGLGGRSQNPFAPQNKNICLNVYSSFTCNSQKMNNPDILHWVSG